METIDFNAINDEILSNLVDLQDGDIDVYTFSGELYDKHMLKFDDNPNRAHDESNPYLDIIFGMLEINNVEMY